MASSSGAYPGGTLQPQPEDDPVFAALEERGLSLNIHVSLDHTCPAQRNTLALPAAGRFTRRDRPPDRPDLHAACSTASPTCRSSFAEVDCGWLPYFKEQLDDGFYRYRFRFDLTKLPSEYVEQHVHFTWVTDTYGIDNRHQIGVDKMLWSSDYPHGNSNYPNAWSPTQAVDGRRAAPGERPHAGRERSPPVQLPAALRVEIGHVCRASTSTRVRRRFGVAEAVADQLRQRILSGENYADGMLPKLEDLTAEFRRRARRPSARRAASSRPRA